MPLFPARQILVPVDFSDGSWAALEVARELVDEVRNLHVVHVLMHLSSLEPGMAWGSVNDATRVTRTRELLGEALAKRGLTDAVVHVELSVGNAAPRIAELAEELQVDAVVLPSQGRTGLARLATGSVAERVVRLCHCPVLVLRG